MKKEKILICTQLFIINGGDLCFVSRPQMFILTEMCLKIRALKTDSTFAGLYLQCNTVLGVTCERWWICKLITIPVRPNEYLKTMPLMRITGHRPEPHLLLNMFNYKTKHMLSRCPEKLLVTKYPPTVACQREQFFPVCSYITRSFFIEFLSGV